MSLAVELPAGAGPLSRLGGRARRQPDSGLGLGSLVLV